MLNKTTISKQTNPVTIAAFMPAQYNALKTDPAINNTDNLDQATIFANK